VRTETVLKVSPTRKSDSRPNDDYRGLQGWSVSLTRPPHWEVQHAGISPVRTPKVDSADFGFQSRSVSSWHNGGRAGDQVTMTP
jgi:hypothetical protein